MQITNGGILLKVFDSDIVNGELTIPNSVTDIEKFAFYWCSSTIITIPDSVKWIHDNAFDFCPNLTNITVDSNNKNYSSANGVLFDKNKTELIQYPIGNTRTSYSIPSSVTSIRAYAFKKCNNLKSITIPNGVKSIGEGAFECCKSLESKKANFKAFNIRNNKLFCRDYKYTPNKWSDKLDNLELCESGYHFCTNLFEIFNYYWGKLDKDIAIYECEVGDRVIKWYSPQCCTNRIKPVKRLYREDVIRVLNGEK